VPTAHKRRISRVAKTRVIKIRVSDEDYEFIKNNAVDGCLSISSYMLSCAKFQKASTMPLRVREAISNILVFGNKLCAASSRNEIAHTVEEIKSYQKRLVG